MRDEVFLALKKVIKSRGLNYKELASEIDMSESGFKKLMASRDCSMSKLDQICETLNLSLGDLITLSEEMDKTKLSFNSKQDFSEGDSNA